VPYAGKVRLILETRNGLQALSGYVLDLSASGCALRLHAQVEPNLAGRIQISIGDREIWLPIVTRWARQDSRGWTVGAEFDRPTTEKQELVRRLVWQRLQ
jgi:PilZ domain-containing protein